MELRLKYANKIYGIARYAVPLGSQINDVMEGLPSLIKLTDTYPLLPVCMRTNDIAKRSFEEIMSDFEAL